MGREVEMVIFEGESHGLSRGGRPGNRIERQRRILGWFQKHLDTEACSLMWKGQRTSSIPEPDRK